MRLHEFLISHREEILQEWESFARRCAPASSIMDTLALRDHASEMLLVISADLKTWQGEDARSEKSMGLSPVPVLALPTAAEEHGAARADSGFTMEQMVSEYRALRASVLRLWTREQGQLAATDIEDLMRFNEAIDQSLAESVVEFNESVRHAREIFLGILGHDLRNPLGAIYTSATFMRDTGELEEPHSTLTARIAETAQRATALVGDLLDFTRGRLGAGIPVKRLEGNLGKIVHDVASEIEDAHPRCHLRVETRDQGSGQWDGARMSQALTNLIGNAVEHSSDGTTVKVELSGNETHACISIHNRGAVIPPSRLPTLFLPMQPEREPSRNRSGPGGNLGLGLYIAERIIFAHGGRIEVESSEVAGTTFTIHVPRRQ